MNLRTDTSSESASNTAVTGKSQRSFPSRPATIVETTIGPSSSLT